MGGKKALQDCRSGSDFNHYVVHDSRVREIRQNGSHVIVKGPLPGSAVFPNHNGDMPNGTRRSVVKMLIAIGLGIMIFVCGLPALQEAVSAQVDAPSTNAMMSVFDSVDGFIMGLNEGAYSK